MHNLVMMDYVMTASNNTEMRCNEVLQRQQRIFLGVSCTWRHPSATQKGKQGRSLQALVHSSYSSNSDKILAGSKYATLMH